MKFTNHLCQRLHAKHDALCKVKQELRRPEVTNFVYGSEAATTLMDREITKM